MVFLALVLLGLHEASSVVNNSGYDWKMDGQRMRVGVQRSRVLGVSGEQVSFLCLCLDPDPLLTQKCFSTSVCQTQCPLCGFEHVEM